MSTFGQELRSQRLSRGIALEQITAVTKICQRHLVALEQDHFRQLPGGILSKGIVRGYAGAVGLDQRDWTERFLRASCAAGQPVEEDSSQGWATFASNVGKERMERHQAMEQRLRWIGAIALLVVAVAASFITVRFYGVHAGWWDTLLPGHLAGKASGAVTHAAALLKH